MTTPIQPPVLTLMLQTVHCVPTWLPSKVPPSRAPHRSRTPHAAFPSQGSMKGTGHREPKENAFTALFRAAKRGLWKICLGCCDFTVDQISRVSCSSVGFSVNKDAKIKHKWEISPCMVLCSSLFHKGQEQTESKWISQHRKAHHAKQTHNKRSSMQSDH